MSADFRNGTVIDSRFNRLLRWLGFYRPPVIMVAGEPVADWVRKQAAANMKADPGLKTKIEKMIGEEQSRIRYFDAY